MPKVGATRVFLVDDHPVTIKGIRSLLESQKDIVVGGEAGCAEESFEKIEAQAVDVVLMDIDLPGIDGIEATRLLKAKHPDLKVVMLSAFEDQDLGSVIEAGACGYILKSATRQELANVVVQAAGGYSPIFDSKLTMGLLDRLDQLQGTGRSPGLPAVDQ